MTTVFLSGRGLNLSAPVLALIDGDPYGIDILSVYKYGSRSLQHESTKLAAGRIKWLGLWSSELDECAFRVPISIVILTLCILHVVLGSTEIDCYRSRSRTKRRFAFSHRNFCVRSISQHPAGSFYAPNTWYAPEVEVRIYFLEVGSISGHLTLTNK
jgi:hypothetical protein